MLRDYQEQAITAIFRDLSRGQTALCVLPTGAGKTITCIEFIKRATRKNQDFKCVFIVQRVNLLEQTRKAFADHNVQAGVWYGKEKLPGFQVTIATVQSLKSFPKDAVNCIVIDEVHNLNDQYGSYHEALLLFLVGAPTISIVGLTATPFRTDGPIYGEGRLFHRPSFVRTMRFMIDRGYLVTPIMKAPPDAFDLDGVKIRMGEWAKEDLERLGGDEKKVCKQVEDALLRAYDRKKIVWFCVSIQHAELVFRTLRNKGEDAAITHSKLKEEVATGELLRFTREDARHLCFVSQVSEGFDHPPIDCVVLMRPTRSPVLYVQVVGRGMRTYPGKENLLVLDYGRVIQTLGPLDDIQVNKRGGRNGLKKNEDAVRVCKNCFGIMEIGQLVCPQCSFEVKREASFVKNITLRPDEDANILREPEKAVPWDVTDVKISKHFSVKKGRYSLKVSYVSTNLLAPNVDEYFSWEYVHLRERAKVRLAQIGAGYFEDLDEQAKQKPTIKVNRIWILPARFPVVVRLECEEKNTIQTEASKTETKEETREGN